jgi:nitrogen regulatory protein P-II 1
MTTVVAVIRPNRFDAVKDALQDLGVSGMTVSEVRGHGRQKGHTETYRGREYDISLLPKLKVEVVGKDDRVDAIVETIIASAATGLSATARSFCTRRKRLSESAIRNAERSRSR